ncbi:MAG: hypothetical protein OHK0015_36310 [Chloroflexi bacterium OHK40]
MSDERAARLAAIRAANTARAPKAVSSAPVDPQPPVLAPQALAVLLLGAAGGALLAAAALPALLPGLTASLLGAEPSAYWLLARSSAMVAYALLWLAMLSGLLMSNRLARVWPGGPTAFALHQHTSLLGLAFSLFHALILLGDRFVAATLAQILVPFAYSGYAPLWVGLGQVALYGLVLVGLSFYVRSHLGQRLWRLVHLLSFVVFALALAHGVMSGSDSVTRPAQVLYWSSGGSVLFLTVYRVLMAARGHS